MANKENHCKACGGALRKDDHKDIHSKCHDEGWDWPKRKEATDGK